MTAALLLLALSSTARAVVATPPDIRPEEVVEQALPPPAADQSPYDLKTLPLSKADLSLFSSALYEFRPDGTLWAPGAEQPVGKTEYPYVIKKLEGAQRLKALIAIDMIYQRSDGGTALSPEDRDSLRKIVRENWRLFAVKTRRDFKRYFSPDEVGALQAQNSRDSVRPLTAPMPPPDEKLREELIGAAPPRPAPAIVPVPAPQPMLPAVLQPLGLVQAAGKPATLPEPPKASTAPILVEQPKPAEVPPALPLPADWNSPEGFEAFLKGAPYTDEVKGLLRLLARRAPEFARGRAMKLVVSRLPEIALDGSRMGGWLRGRVMIPPGSIALNPGPLLYAKRSLFFANEEVLVGEDPETYSRLHLDAAPEALDLSRMPKSREKAAWGETAYFEDGSARGTFSEPERAGVLLHELLLLDQRLDDPTASPYLMEVFARTAQFMFYAALRPSNNGDAFLDPDERAAFREWLAHPQEARDHLAHTFFTGRRAPLDDEALAALSRPNALSQELLRLERKFRQETPVEQK